MKNNLIKSSAIFSVMTFFSRILGFMRDMVAAHVFGAGPGYDAFILAFRIPNLMRRLFAEGAFSQAFVPVFAEYRVKKNHAEVKSFISKVAGDLGLVVLLVSILGMIGAPLIIKLFAPGFSHEQNKLILAVHMLRITFPYIFFISITALVGGVLNSFGRFGAAAFTPIFLNICMIVASLYWTNYFAVAEYALAWGVSFGGLVQLIFLIGFLKRDDLLVRPKICWQDPGVRRVLLLMLPAIFGAAINQINLLVDTLFASFLPSGSISWLYYSDRLMEFPLGIFGVGFATVVLPQLARLHARGASAEFSATLDWGLRSVLLVGTPAMLGLYLLAGPLLATLFQTGRFAAHDVVMSSKSLMAYAVAVVGIMLSKMLSSAFYACQDIKTPVRISAFILFANVALISVLIGPLAHAGLALATSLSSLINAAILGFMLAKKQLYRPQPGWRKFFLRLLAANLALYGIITASSADLSAWLSWGMQARIYRLAPIILASAVAYLGVLWMVGLRPKDLFVQGGKL